MTEAPETPGPLRGVKVVDVSNLIAGPMASTFLGDFGADVIKVEHPKSGDPLRNHGQLKGDQPLWWKYLGRNKRTVTLDLGEPEGAEILLALVDNADVVIENFRPGTMAKWGLGYDNLSTRNPRIVMAHVSGFGQVGPMSHRPGFGTLAESMSGFTHRNGMPDGAPILPPFGLADNVTGIITAYAVMTALWERNLSGKGQEIDVAIIESLLPVLEPQIVEYDQLGTVMNRQGNRNPMNAPRNIYLTSDDRWVAISASTQSTSDRMLTLAGHPEMLDEPWFQTAHGRAAHVEEIDEAVGSWVAKYTLDEVLAACDEVSAPASGIYSVADICADPQYGALSSVARVEDPALGPVRMPNVQFRLSRTPGSIRWPGAEMGQHNDEVFAEIGITTDRLARLKEQGIV